MLSYTSRVGEYIVKEERRKGWSKREGGREAGGREGEREGGRKVGGRKG